ncbi:MAG: fatty acid desaturase [Cytophaga sp.]|uniref:fatty acid desaturase n=1 Tax=Cytophaga sp. TaxID=29535 RepID=UPI003F7D36E7
MTFIDRVLDPPSYGWMNSNGDLIKPSSARILSEWTKRINIFKSRKNWLAITGWLWVLLMIPFPVIFFTKHFNVWFLALGFFYAMVIMSTHGTIWYHRYCTHKAFKFRNKLWMLITQNLVIKMIPEEVYVISHHVHHAKSDLPGDPYNAQGGFLYCFLADTNHQQTSKTLDEKDYSKVVTFLSHTGIKINSYSKYKKWGSVTNPLYTIILWIFNWSFWYILLYLVGGHSLACALFTGAMAWVIGVRGFNYTGHGKGKDERKDGVDYNRKDLSINQLRPGLTSGEWHNNHHLFPGSARAGFLSYQLDFAWCYIYIMYKLGAVVSYHDSKKLFLKQYYYPSKLNLK